MSAAPTNYIHCPQIQEYLERQFTEFDPTEQREAQTFLEVITSPMNTKDILQNQVSTKGKIKTVEVKFMPRFLTTEVSDSIDRTCASGTDAGEYSETYTIDPNSGSQIRKQLTLSELIEVCQDDEFYVAKLIRKMMDVLARSMNEKTITQAATLFGINPVNNTTLLTTKTKTGNTLLSDMITDVKFTMVQSELANVVPFVFGGSRTYWEYIAAYEMSCCNAVQNIDIPAYANKFGFIPYFDRLAEDAFGENHFATIVPGALQLLTFNQNVGSRGITVIDTETEKVDVLVDPFNGVAYDFRASYDCGTWTFDLAVAHELVGMPETLFSNGDRLQGVTYNFDNVIVN